MLILVMSLLACSVMGMCTSMKPRKFSYIASSAVSIPIGSLYASLAYTLLKDKDREVRIDEEEHHKLFSSFIKPYDRVLEVGIGPGLSKIEEYYPDGILLKGIDVIAGKAITEATARNHAYTPILGSAEEMSMFEDGEFDVVVSTFSLCTIPNPRKALLEISRVLKRDGYLISVEHVFAAPHKERDKEKEGLLGAMGFGLREQQRLLDPLQQSVAHGCHLTRQTDQLLRDMVTSGQFSSLDVIDYVDFSTKWPISSQVFAVLKK